MQASFLASHSTLNIYDAQPGWTDRLVEIKPNRCKLQANAFYNVLPKNGI